MGMHHVGTLSAMDSARITAVCDLEEQKLDAARQRIDSVQTFTDYHDMLNPDLIDAVLIATPHYDHPPIAQAAFAKGIHVLSEKPVAVDVKQARLTNELHATRYSHLKYGAMFQMRTSGLYCRIRDLVASGELGEILRFSWVVTDWFRTWTYYASGGWRATWDGEGGGVLLNQCPHNLDLIQWILGGRMPNRVTAVVFCGKTHPIPVEDEVSAIMEYPDGITAHFIATTGEAPGTNRMEIAGDRGLLVSEGGRLTFRRTTDSVRNIRENSEESFPSVETWNCEIPVKKGASGTRGILENFVNAIVNDEPLIAPAQEGVRGLEMGNAMLWSGLTRRPVDLPIDGDAYAAFLQDLIRNQDKTPKIQRRVAQVDMSTSFTK